MSLCVPEFQQEERGYLLYMSTDGVTSLAFPNLRPRGLFQLR